MKFSLYLSALASIVVASQVMAVPIPLFGLGSSSKEDGGEDDVGMPESSADANDFGATSGGEEGRGRRGRGDTQNGMDGADGMPPRRGRSMGPDDMASGGFEDVPRRGGRRQDPFSDPRGMGMASGQGAHWGQQQPVQAMHPQVMPSQPSMDSWGAPVQDTMASGGQAPLFDAWSHQPAQAPMDPSFAQQPQFADPQFASGPMDSQFAQQPQFADSQFAQQPQFASGPMDSQFAQQPQFASIPQAFGPSDPSGGFDQFSGADTGFAPSFGGMPQDAGMDAQFGPPVPNFSATFAEPSSDPNIPVGVPEPSAPVAALPVDTMGQQQAVMDPNAMVQQPAAAAPVDPNALAQPAVPQPAAAAPPAAAPAADPNAAAAAPAPATPSTPPAEASSGDKSSSKFLAAFAAADQAPAASS